MARFDDYVDPVGRPAAPPDENAPNAQFGLSSGGGARSEYAGPDVGYGEDIAKGTVGGLGRGTAGVIGGGGSLLRTIGTKAFNTAVPALTSETAGQLTKGTAAEPYARFVAGMAAGPLAGKIITPSAPASAFRQRDVATLAGEGIPLSAG